MMLILHTHNLALGHLIIKLQNRSWKIPPKVDPKMQSRELHNACNLYNIHLQFSLRIDDPIAFFVTEEV